MITCNLMGGLGNQLFQIFATISFALDRNQRFLFLNSQLIGEGTTKSRKTYWNTFLKPLFIFLKNNINIYCSVKEAGFTYAPIKRLNYDADKVCMIYGYFQSYKYFDIFFPQICKLIRLEKQKEEVMLSVAPYFNEPIENYISMHFRIGDYKNLQDQYRILEYSYYKEALDCILGNEMKEEKGFEAKPNSVTQGILYFCEEHDLEEVSSIICKLKEDVKFTHYKFIRADPRIDDWQQMLMMSCCRHNIIENSTFSWWGAYFNSNPDKIVCSPEKWFSKEDLVTDDLLPESWIKL